jgi:hypothetical protein
MEDFDGDGLLDIMTTSIGLRDPMHFFHNNGDGTFTDRMREAGLTGEVGGLNLIQADYNNDGFMDVLVLRGAWFGTEGHHPKSLLRNNGDGTFTDVTEEAGLLSLHPTQTAVWFDLNNDGLVDLYIGHESDIDNDGDQDIFEVMGGAYAGDKAYSVLYENPGNKNHWITLKLEGVKSNRAAIGARIKVQTTGPHGTRFIYRTVGSGGSFGCNPLRQEMGLGDAAAISVIEVYWPVTGKTQVFAGPAMDQFYTIREDSETLQVLHLKSFKFPAHSAEHHHIH